MTKEERIDILSIVKEDTKNIFKLAEETKEFTYTDPTGDVTEAPNKYCSRLTRCMVHEIFTLFTGLYADRNEEWAKKVKNWCQAMETKDLTIRRMLDDRKDHRQLSEYNFKDTDDIIDEIKALEEMEAENSIIGLYKEKIKNWVRRFKRLDIIAFYIKSKDASDNIIQTASMRATDDDGNIVYGVDEDDELRVRIIALIKQTLLSALVKLPEDCKEVSICMDKIKNIEGMMNLIATGQSEKLTYLIKCAEAAEEFKDAE